MAPKLLLKTYDLIVLKCKKIGQVVYMYLQILILSFKVRVSQMVMSTMEEDWESRTKILGPGSYTYIH